MPLRVFFALAFVLSILVVQFTAARFYVDGEDDYDEYRLLKRFLFHKSTAASTSQAPSVLDNLIHPSSTKKPPIGPEKSTYSPSYPSSGVCASNSCEHGGICIPKGQTIYECKCIGPWRGIYCGIADACYKSPCLNGGTCLNVHDDYWCKCTNDYYGSNCQSKFSNPTYPENHCRSNICNTGRCVSLKTTYYCECPNDRYGEHCEKRFSRRGVSSAQSYSDLSHQLRRNIFRQNMRHKQGDRTKPEVAYYDPTNGIYF